MSLLRNYVGRHTYRLEYFAPSERRRSPVGLASMTVVSDVRSHQVPVTGAANASNIMATTLCRLRPRRVARLFLHMRTTAIQTATANEPVNGGISKSRFAAAGVPYANSGSPPSMRPNIVQGSAATNSRLSALAKPPSHAEYLVASQRDEPSCAPGLQSAAMRLRRGKQPAYSVGRPPALADWRDPTLGRKP
jgi:hypothetical protein